MPPFVDAPCWRDRLIRRLLKTDAPATPALFFPAAALYGALIPLLSMAAMSGNLPGLTALATGLGHAHEMLFGYALAVVAGYVAGPLPRWRLWTLFLFWLSARVLYLAVPDSMWPLMANIGFPLLLAMHAAPRFANSAKKWRNKTLAPLLVALCVMAVAADVVRHADGVLWQRAFQLEAMLMLSLLMLFMGGRIIAPAAAGQFQRQGITLEARVQPRLEGALILGMSASLLLAPLSQLLAAWILLITAAIAWVRLLRWRLWACRERPDLWWLGVGYGWLGVGLMLFAGVLANQLPSALGIHAITVGALGTLTLGVMARTRLQWAKRDPARVWVIPVGSALISAAALARLLSVSPMIAGTPLLWVAAGLWALALVILAVFLLRLRICH